MLFLGSGAGEIGRCVYECFHLTVMIMESKRYEWDGVAAAAVVDAISRFMLTKAPTKLKRGDLRCPEDWDRMAVGGYFVGGKRKFVCRV